MGAWHQHVNRHGGNLAGKEIILLGAAVSGISIHSVATFDKLLNAQEQQRKRNQRVTAEVAIKRAKDIKALNT